MCRNTARVVMLFVTFIAVSLGASAQQQISFGTFYGRAATVPSVSFLPQVGGTYQLISEAAGCTTSVGKVAMPQNINNPQGRGAYEANAQFNSNGVNGSFSGTCTATYSGTPAGSSNTNQVNVTVNFSGDSMVPTEQAAPAYQIMSILYDPPGSSSSSGFTNTTSAGATNSTVHNFSTSDTVTFSGGVGGFSGSITYNNTFSNMSTQAYQTTYSASSQSQLFSAKQDIDHTQDQFFLWVNPTINVTQTGANVGYFSLANLDSSGSYVNNNMNIVNVSVAEMLNPPTIPLYVLEAVTVSPGVTLPGLENVCAHPLPVAQCTQANACGCVASDFTNIIAQDELATDTIQSKAPNTIDPNRYAYLTYVQLEGPAVGGSGSVKNTFSLMDATQACTSYATGHSYAVGISGGWKFGLGGSAFFGVSNSTTWTVGQSESSGNCNGQSHTGAVTMGSSTAGCFYDVDVYEDTIYHTFAFALPTAPTLPTNACNFTHD